MLWSSQRILSATRSTPRFGLSLAFAAVGLSSASAAPALVFRPVDRAVSTWRVEIQSLGPTRELIAAGIAAAFRPGRNP